MSATSIDKSPHPDSAVTNQTPSSPICPESSEGDAGPISPRSSEISERDSFTAILTREGSVLRGETADSEARLNQTDIPTAKTSHRDLLGGECQLSLFQPDFQVSEVKIDATRIGD